MNQVIELFQQSNVRMKRLMKSLDGLNKPDMEVITAAQRECEDQLKGINAVASLFSVFSKNKRAEKQVANQGIMDGTTAIDMMLGDPEVDKVKCPIQDKIITRADCLDYSGKPENMAHCQGCEIGSDTKRKLVDISPHIA